MKTRVICSLFALAAALLAAGCASVSTTTIDDGAVYEAQDQAFRPMGP